MKLNKFFRYTLPVFLFTLPFLIGCGEDREMRFHFPNIDLPDSVTVTVEAPAGAAFDLAVSGDFREETDVLGNRHSSFTIKNRSTLLQKISARHFR